MNRIGKTPKLSVIVPVYGVEKYIERCARSLFEQTLTDIEFIFIDDRTLDNSMVILDGIIKMYRPCFVKKGWTVTIDTMPTNSGLPAVRRHGIQLATGEYIAHCDSDDWVDKEMYKQMYDAAKASDADCVVCDYFKTDGKSNHRRVKACHSDKINIYFENLLFQRDSWTLWNKLFRKTIYNKEIVFPKYAMGEDFVLCIQLVWNSKTMVYINKPFYNYYFNDQSITKSVSEEAIEKRFHQSVMNAEDILTFFKNNGIYEKYEEALECLLINKKNILLPLISSKVKHLIALSPLRFFLDKRNNA